ncbi:enoyl-CoA hydratase-related protein [Reinekea sp.]|jgi:methylglutaconyl-CoA hydratase|uniref:enoyl-CoA hydratase-related protein n=1 Tax=Reinekea sp. TaxID=1970455 RepID=UPI002A7EDE19|nr:enoyl-CoA hydratase-related protein [Reinekea sp.]
MLIEQQQDAVLTLTLNRPEVRNAFNAELIALLTQAIDRANADESVRVVVLRGTGEHFCAGADLQWMAGMAALPMADNVADARALGTLMLKLDQCRKAVVSQVQGAVMGGGVGLVACSDVVLADPTTFFALSETRLGLTPATIAPFVVEAIGARQARRYMLSAQRIDADCALQLGLVHQLASPAELPSVFAELIKQLLRGGPTSHRKIKKLIRDVTQRVTNDDLMDNLSWRIANQRISAEGQEGMQAFLTKRPPNWSPEADQ